MSTPTGRTRSRKDVPVHYKRDGGEVGHREPRRSEVLVPGCCGTHEWGPLSASGSPSPVPDCASPSRQRRVCRRGTSRGPGTRPATSSASGPDDPSVVDLLFFYPRLRDPGVIPEDPMSPSSTSYLPLCPSLQRREGPARTRNEPKGLCGVSPSPSTHDRQCVILTPVVLGRDVQEVWSDEVHEGDVVV